MQHIIIQYVHVYMFCPPIIADWASTGMVANPASALAESDAYSSNSTCSNTFAGAAAPYQAFRDNVPCLLCALISRRRPNWSSEKAHMVNALLNLPNRRVSTTRLNREDS